MIKARIGVTISCLVLAASLSQAQFVAPVHIVPVVVKSAGVGGASWLSDLSIANVSDEAAVVGISFFREDTTHSLLDLATWEKEVTIDAGATLLVEDVLGSWFPGEGNGKGFLVVADTGALLGEENAWLAVSSRAYDAADPNATFGQTVPSSLVSVLIGPGRIVMAGAREDGQFRSNVGVLNGGLQQVDVVITIYDSTGSQVAQRTKTIKAMSMGQWSLQSLGVSSLSGGGRVDVRIADGFLPADPCQFEINLGLQVGVIMAYLSKADNVTNDAEFVLGQVDWSDYEDECGTTPDGCR